MVSSKIAFLSKLFGATFVFFLLFLIAVNPAIGSNDITIDLPLDPTAKVHLTAGFGAKGHHVGKAQYAIDIAGWQSGAQGTAIIAPFDGTVVYQRFANGAFNAQGVRIGERIPACQFVRLIRDDDINSANALWTLSIRQAGSNIVVTILHVSKQTLVENPPATGPLSWTSGTFNVSQGDIIGKIGGGLGSPGSGCSTGPHIHLEVSNGGKLKAFEQSVEFSMKVRINCDTTGCQPKILNSSNLSDNTLFNKPFWAPLILLTLLNQFFENAATEFNIPSNILKAVGEVESGWNQAAHSPDGGYGIMQLTGSTLDHAAALIGVSPAKVKENSLEGARANIRAGAAYLDELSNERYLISGTPRDSLEAWWFVLVRYNGLGADLNMTTSNYPFRIFNRFLDSDTTKTPKLHFSFPPNIRARQATYYEAGREVFKHDNGLQPRVDSNCNVQPYPAIMGEHPRVNSQQYVKGYCMRITPVFNADSMVFHDNDGNPIGVNLVRAQGHFISLSGIDYGNDPVFWLQNKKYYHVLYEAQGKNIIFAMSSLDRWGWDKISDFSTEELIQYFQDHGYEEATHPDGSLIEFIAPDSRSDSLLIQKQGDPKVYLIENGQRRWITSPEVFNQQGYDWQDIIEVTQPILDLIPEGPPITDFNILSPTEQNPFNAGPKDSPRKIDIEIYLSQPSLKKEDFKVFIGTKEATIITLSPRSKGYILTIEPPKQNANGLYDLTVSYTLHDPITISDTEAKAILYSEAANVDVVLVIDRSGSMSGSKIADAKSAAQQFVSLMRIGDKVAVVSYSSAATVDYPLTEITSQSDKDAVQSIIGNISAWGSTSIGAGLQKGQEQLTTWGDPGNAQAMVLMSDGHENTPPYVSEILPNIPEKTDVYTIAFGPNPNEALLQDIALETGGQYYRSYTGQDLQAIYNQIAGAVTGQELISSQTGIVNQSMTTTLTTMIDSTITVATFLVGWSGSDLDLTLERPDGSLIDPNVAAADPNITFVSAATFESYTIHSLMPGSWKIIVKGVNVPSSGESFIATVSGTSNLTFDTFLDKDQYSTGQPITVLASLSEGAQPLTGATVTVEVQVPAQSIASWPKVNQDTMPTLPMSANPPVIMALYDDGRHGDGPANDGVYGNIFTDTAKAGSYVFTFNASGTTTVGEGFTRATSRSVFVSQVAATGSISGTISSSSSITGSIHIGAWLNDPTFSGNPDYEAVISAPGPYTVTNLPDGIYYIRAFLDSNNDGILNPGEIHRAYGVPDPVSLSGGQAITGIDIALITLGDVNGDGVVNAFDTQYVTEGILNLRTLTPEEIAACDVAPPGSPDGDCNAFDVQVLVEFILGLRTSLSAANVDHLGQKIYTHSSLKATLELGTQATVAPGEITSLYLSLKELSGPGLIALQVGPIYRFRFNPQVIHIQAVKGVGSFRVLAPVVINNEGGEVQFIAISTQATLTGPLVELIVQAVGPPGSESILDLESIDVLGNAIMQRVRARIIPGKIKIAQEEKLKLENIYILPNPVSNTKTVQFKVEGTNIASTRVLIYNLSGSQVFDSGFMPEFSLEWHLESNKGQLVANGVYLYFVMVRGPHGEVIKSDVKKLVVVR